MSSDEIWEDKILYAQVGIFLIKHHAFCNENLFLES